MGCLSGHVFWVRWQCMWMPALFSSTISSVISTQKEIEKNYKNWFKKHCTFKLLTCMASYFQTFLISFWILFLHIPFDILWYCYLLLTAFELIIYLKSKYLILFTLRQPKTQKVPNVLLQNIGDEAIAAISNHCLGLQAICLSDCNHITDTSLRALGTGCHDLR